MDFKFEEILKNIFPGLLLFATGYFYCTGIVPFYNGHNPFPPDWKDFSEIILVGILIIAFIIGYFNDIVASWLEDYFLFWITKRPAYQLLTKKTNRITLINREELFNSLKKGCKEITSATAANITPEDAKKLFQFAKIEAEKEASDVVKEKMDALYKALTFSRNFFTAFLFLAAAMIIRQKDITLNKYIFFSIVVLIGILLFLRWRERSLYHARLILTTAHSSSKSNILRLRQQKAATIAEKEAEKADIAAKLAQAEAEKIAIIASDLQAVIDALKNIKH